MSLELDIPPLGLDERALQARFDALQARLIPLWRTIEDLEDRGEQTVVVIPSLTVDYAALRGSVLQAYEERFLFLLLLLRQPRARLVYVTSQVIQPEIVDYYLHLLPGVVASHARARLHLLSPQDGAPQPLSIKCLQRPRFLEQIRRCIKDTERAHLVPFNTTEHERALALRLGIPMFAADPRLLPLGTKTGCRRLFRDQGMLLPEGFEGLHHVDEVVEALRVLKGRRPELRQAMVKHDEGVSGAGNAVVDLEGVDTASRDAVLARVMSMRLEAKDLSIDDYLAKLEAQGGIVEERVLGRRIVSPSVQLRITPLGRVEILSTHDQLLGGSEGQQYTGCRFPADTAYASLIAREARKVGDRLVREGVLGRFAIDFVCAERDDGFHPYAIELNLRKGGTTHPYLTLQFLTNGHYDADTARFQTAGGRAKAYVATDDLAQPSYRALTVHDLFDIVARHCLHFDQTRQTGVVLHMMSAVGDHGRLGLTAIADTLAEAQSLYDRTCAILDAEAHEALTSTPLAPQS